MTSFGNGSESDPTASKPPTNASLDNILHRLSQSNDRLIADWAAALRDSGEPATTPRRQAAPPANGSAALDQL